MKKTVSILLSILMLLSVFSAVPLTASADGNDAQTIIEGSIVVEDELAIWNVNDNPERVVIYQYEGSAITKNDFKGFSYDTATNTLTIKDTLQKNAAFLLIIDDMQDLKIKLVGVSAIAFLKATNTNLSFVGNGELTIGAPCTFTEDGEERVNEYVRSGPLTGENVKVSVSNTVTLKFDAQDDDDLSFDLSFDKPQTLAQVFDCKAVPSKELNWEVSEEDNSYEESMYARDCYVKTQFSAGDILRREGDTDKNNYWVYTKRVGSNYKDRLLKRIVPLTDGLWIEAPDNDDNAYYEADGTDPAKYYHYSDVVSSEGFYLYPTAEQQLDEKFYSVYTKADFSDEMLVNGKLVVALRPELDLSSKVYSKDDELFVYNLNTAPDYHFDFYKLEIIKQNEEKNILEPLGDLGDFHAENFKVEPDESGKYIYNGKEYDSAYEAEYMKYNDFVNQAPAYLSEQGYKEVKEFHEIPKTYCFRLPVNKYTLAPNNEEPTTEATAPTSTVDPYEPYYEEPTAATEPPTEGETEEIDYFGYIRAEEQSGDDWDDCEIVNGFGDPVTLNEFKGMSYDVESKTLTLNNVKGKNISVMFDQMFDVNIKVIGDCVLKKMSFWDSSPKFIGNGKLTLEEGFDSSIYYKSKDIVTIGPNVTVTLKKSKGYSDDDYEEKACAGHISVNTMDENYKPEDFFKYEGKASEEPKWEDESDGNRYAEEQQSVDYLKMRTTFPATKLLKKLDFEGENNIFVASIYSAGSNPERYHFICQLVEKDGYWFEVTSNSYWNKDELFVPYTEEEIKDLPDTLVNKDGVATAYLSLQTNYGKTYTKDGETYVLSREGLVRNVIVDPITPPESEEETEGSPLVLLRLARTYHSTPSNLVTYHDTLYLNEAGSQEKREALLKEKGYEPEMVMVDYGLSPDLYLVNDEITFSPDGSVPTEATTAEPTEKPTEVPTAEPTAKPTEAPTVEPTKAPAVEPTEAPTSEPTEAPTSEPTEAPTAEPTEAPTAEPTEAPTAEPTEAPTVQPTEAPTENPTSAVVTEPTQSPTIAPATQKPVSTVTKKKDNTLKVTVKNKAVKAKKLKKKPQKVYPITIKNAKGTVTCKLKNVPKALKKYISVTKKGTIKLKRWKNAKKGKYTVEVTVTAKGNKSYKAKKIVKKFILRIK